MAETPLPVTLALHDPAPVEIQHVRFSPIGETDRKYKAPFEEATVKR